MPGILTKSVASEQSAGTRTTASVCVNTLRRNKPSRRENPLGNLQGNLQENPKGKTLTSVMQKTALMINHLRVGSAMTAISRRKRRASTSTNTTKGLKWARIPNPRKPRLTQPQLHLRSNNWPSPMDNTANTGLLGVDLQKSPQNRVIGDQVTKVEGYWENRRAIGDQVTKVEGYWGPSDQSGGLLGILGGLWEP